MIFNVILGLMYRLLPGSISEEIEIILAYFLSALFVILICFIADKISKKILLRGIKKFVDKTKTTYDEMIYDKKVFHSLSHIVPALIIYLFADSFGSYQVFIQKACVAYIICLSLLIIFRIFDAGVDIYNTFSFAKNRPIKGLVQVTKILIGVFFALLLFVTLMGNAAGTVLIGSVGGLSAVILLIFKDSILGLVAGIQLSTGNLLAIGDWLEMPKFGADGEVVDISLTKIQVRNWDKTYTSVPAYKFIEESFKNWSGMTEAGGRRIKRSVLIDMNTIGFLSNSEIDSLKNIKILRPYLDEKLSSIENYNSNLSAEENNAANARALTNVGTFRAYIEEYLLANDKIQSEGFTLIVRQLPSTEAGLPIEVYCFTTEIAWAVYEGIQSDIFDHLFSIAPMFGLRIFQNPAGSDFKKIMS